jgi:hypothetical protein
MFLKLMAVLVARHVVVLRFVRSPATARVAAAPGKADGCRLQRKAELKKVHQPQQDLPLFCRINPASSTSRIAREEKRGVRPGAHESRAFSLARRRAVGRFGKPLNRLAVGFGLETA